MISKYLNQATKINGRTKPEEPILWPNLFNDDTQPSFWRVSAHDLYYGLTLLIAFTPLGEIWLQGSCVAL